MPRCKNCREKFTQEYFLQKTCSDECEKVYRKDNPKKKLNKVSERRKAQEAIYRQLKPIYMKQNPNCGKCGKKAQDIHHKAGRNGTRLNDVVNFMAVCRPCHTWIHENSQEARKKGWLK